MENASIDGAKAVLVNLAGGDNLTLQEYQNVVDLITKNCAEDALIIVGQSYNPALGDRIKVTVVATGFDHREVTTAVPDADLYRRKSEQAYQEKPREEFKREEVKREEPPKKESTSSDAGFINVNRWQDLQNQLGKRQGRSDDYSIPAVMRINRNDEDNR